MLLAVYNIIKYNIKYTHIAHASFCDTVECCRQRSRARMRHNDKPHMLTFKPFTTLLNITLNKPTLCVKTSQICGALCRKPFVSEHAQCEGLRSPKGLPLCSDNANSDFSQLIINHSAMKHSIARI